MRTPVDALRSVKKHVALVLGDDWEVRLWSDDVKSSFPMARVAVTGPVAYNGHPIYPDATMPLSVYCYDEPLDNVQEGITRAMMVEDALFRAFRGYEGLGAPERVPLYDYDGVPLEGVDSGSDERWASDYLRILDCSVSHVHDPTDDRFIVVAADVRTTWRRAFHADPGNLVQSLRIEFDARLIATVKE
jgi:hypothetical protein